MMRTMKDSGIEWVGRVPQSWSVNPIRAEFQEVTEKNKLGLVKNALKFTYGNIVKKDNFDADDDNYVADTILNYTVVNPGTIMLNGLNLNFDFVSQRVALVKERGIITSAYIAFAPNSNGYISSQFITYLLKAYDGCKAFHNMGGGVRKILNFSELKKQYIVYPTLVEQQRIADFLDAKCAEIDALTADIQTQIDTLEQYKRSVITETVTKGLNPNAEMKDSGIDGAEVTPSHWKTTKLCYECYIRARLGWRGLKADEYVDEGYAFISAFNIQNGKLVWTPLNYITKERFDESPEIKLHSGDVLIVKDGAGVGKCARVDDLPMGGTAPNSSIAVITPSKNLDYRYVCYYLQSAVFNNFVLLLYNGMGVPHLTQEVMSKIKILVPPLKEQMVISDYLDAKCTEIDAVVETKKSQLATLDEYKKSLIFEYVTGKKEVV